MFVCGYCCSTMVNFYGYDLGYDEEESEPTEMYKCLNCGSILDVEELDWIQIDPKNETLS